MIEQRYRDTAPPNDWQPKSPFFKWLWAKLEISQLEALKIPLSGRMTCPHCRTTFAVSVHMDEPMEVC